MWFKGVALVDQVRLNLALACIIIVGITLFTIDWLTSKIAGGTDWQAPQEHRLAERASGKSLATACLVVLMVAVIMAVLLV